MILTITLPLPHKGLSPNARCHWRAKAKHTKAYRRAAFYAARSATAAEPRWTTARTSVRWYTKTVRHPDADNALSSLKACWDGMKDAGILADDNGLAHEPIRFAKDAANQRVELDIHQDNKGSSQG